MNENLQQLQKTELEILLEFKRICDKYHFTYYLVAGTLLGAVRHQGFIPWDDDVDVAMFRKDFEKFQLICKSELSPKYFLQTRGNDKQYFMQIVKIRKHNTFVCETELEHLDFHKGVYIDIFILDKLPKCKFLAKWAFKFQYLLTDSIKIQSGIAIQYTGKNPLLRLIFLCVSKQNLNVLYAMQDSFISILNRYLQGFYYGTLAGRHGYPAEVYKKEWLEGTTELLFEGHRFSAPVQWDAVLSNMYGDYRKLPENKEIHFSYFKI